MELVKINASEYGLEESKAKEIEAQFQPMLQKMTELEKEFNKILELEINEETCEKAKELRLRYVKVRTGTSEIHKTQKAFYLAGGRFVDGWKNAQIFASQGIEEKLLSIEKHFENLEKERKQKLQEERQAEVNKYEPEMIVNSLGEMEESVWVNYINGVKLNYESRIAAEKKAEEERLEKERIAKLNQDRKELILPYHEFLFETDLTVLGLMNQDEFVQLIEQLKAKKSEYNKKQEEIRKEKERLEIEAKEKEKLLKKEREERERIEKEERLKREKLEAQLKAKKEAEQKEIQRKLEEKRKADEAQKAAQLAPDKDKLIALSERIINIPLPQLSNKEAQKILDEVTQLLFKVDAYIKDKTKLL